MSIEQSPPVEAFEALDRPKCRRACEQTGHVVGWSYSCRSDGEDRLTLVRTTAPSAEGAHGLPYPLACHLMVVGTSQVGRADGGCTHGLHGWIGGEVRAPPVSHIHLIYLHIEQRTSSVNKAILNVRRGELDTAQHESQRVKTFSIRCRLKAGYLQAF